MFDVSMSERSRKASSQISNERKTPSEGSVPRTISDGHHQHSSMPPHQTHQFEEVTAAEAAISSTETLLRNIQGLLQVAADNAKQQERRINLERGKITNLAYFHLIIVQIKWPHQSSYRSIHCTIVHCTRHQMHGILFHLIFSNRF